MNTAAEHPSFLALDRFVLGAAKDATIALHVERCARCQRHVADVARAQTIPAWVRELPGISPPERLPHRGRRLLWWLTIGAALAVPAMVLLVPRLRPGPSDATSYVGEKGGAAVWTFVKRGDSVTQWDGASPLFAGDRVRLTVDPGGFPRVTVAAAAGGTWTVLYAGDVKSRQPVSLPVAWAIDGRSPREHLAVVLSSRPLSPEAVSGMLAASSREGVWLTELIFPVRTGADAGR